MRWKIYEQKKMLRKMFKMQVDNAVRQVLGAVGWQVGFIDNYKILLMVIL